ncbi:helix-turn-helix transcriptional regulator [Phreatobacter cathodiphilus]|uniref:HTH araC/xylS-type domain-containing protein n=1 Tax=Phreatobacter cathodiphilus TaxID=1868589 RepID=A0A2S0N6T3_9HYPH|nr:helix-turn-helix domain-containing protein [Phreatobacter cathodiphilus]AVO43874.1 hypothetical protein C6569_01645 [Phreatobacter cathodiphilus]
MFPHELLFGKATFRDSEQAADHIGRATDCRISIEPAAPRSFALDVQFVSNGSIFVLDSFNHSGARTYTENGVRCVGIRTVTQGASGIIRGTDDVAITSGQGMIFDTARSKGHLAARNTRKRLVLLCFDRVAEMARVMIDRSIGDDWPWVHVFDVDSPVGRGLGAHVESTAANIELAHRAGHSVGHSLRLSEEALVMFLLEHGGVFNGPGDCEGVAAPSARQVERALDLINAMTTPLTVTDIAATVGLSVRALQLAFRRRLGASPHAMIKRARLRQARDLLESGEVSSVRDAADRLGFSNVARLSGEYREAFGETPLTTLKRALGDPTRERPDDGTEH